MDITSAIARGKFQHGEKFDPSDLMATDSRIRNAYESGQRIIAVDTYSDGSSWVRAGRVGMTTGWKPAFLILWSESQIGSSDVVSERTAVIATQASDGCYYAVKGGGRIKSPRGSLGAYLEAGESWNA